MHQGQFIVFVLLSLASFLLVSSVPIPESSKAFLPDATDDGDDKVVSGVIAGGAQIDHLNNGIQQIQLPVSEFSDWHNESRQRDKQKRIDYIQQFVLMTLGKNNRAPASFPSSSSSSSIPILNRTNTTATETQTTIRQTFTGESHTFTASCDLPEGVDSEIWRENDMFRIYFNTSSIGKESLVESEDGSRVKMNLNLLTSKLMLYKIGRGLNPEPANYNFPQTTELCNSSQRYNTPEFRGAEFPLLLSDTEDKIFVRLYWYTAPVTKHHYKKKLLDTKTVLVKESRWIIFDIQKAVKTWIDKSLNYGLVIEVENEDNDLVDGAYYFGNRDCGDNSDLSSITAPRVDLCTISLPIDTSGIKRPISFPISSFLPSNRRSSTDESLEEGGLRTTTELPLNHHRHRHHHGSFRSARKHRVTQNEDTNNSMMQGDSPYNNEPITSTEFSLADDHPLKQIFATAKTYLSREELYNRRRRKQQRRRFQDFLQRTETEISNEESSGSDSDTLTEFEPIFVENQNIYIGSSSSDNNRQSRSSRSSSSNHLTSR